MQISGTARRALDEPGEREWPTEREPDEEWELQAAMRDEDIPKWLKILDKVANIVGWAAIIFAPIWMALGLIPR